MSGVNKMDGANIRLLTGVDFRRVDRIYSGSAWVMAHFVPEELPRLLATRPALGAFTPDGRLRAFALATSIVPPCAWFGGFGVDWNERDNALSLLDDLLPPWYNLVRDYGATLAYYSGYDPDNDWLREPLLERGYHEVMRIRSYDKIGFDSPTEGNLSVRVRPFRHDDLAAILDIEEVAFTPPWRHDAREFLEFAADYPFFVVAELPSGEVAGYQFSGVEGDQGFFVRIAVHPRHHSQGIGARLMAEAMRYFAGQHILRILLNTEEANTHAHRLYEWFGFEQVAPQGFVLEREL